MRAALLLFALAAVAVAEDAPKPAEHESRKIGGWTVLVDARLQEPANDALGRRSLALLEDHLRRINDSVAPDRLEKLHAVTIQLDLTHGSLTSMQYHPNVDWLAGHGFAKELAKRVHIPDAARFADPPHQHTQPWCVLHELAHSFHDQVLGFEEPRIKAAHAEYKGGGHGDNVLHADGRRKKHYALTNQMEFFAEMSECYFGTNDFFPFVHGELKDAEPGIYALLREVWGPPAWEKTQTRAAEVREATRRGLALVTRAANNWPKRKTCFSCHHQTLPILAAIETARAGFPMNEAWLSAQTAITHEYFQQRTGDMDDGEHVPGGSTTAGYGLWALSMAKRPADETTTAIVTYLLKIQGMARLQGRAPSDLSRLPNGRWTTSCRRPPLQGSDVADTVLALLGMEEYATAEQRPPLATARAAAEKWLAQAPLQTQEDRIWRLWGLHHLGGDNAASETVRKAILKAQHEDGGWPQNDERQSDAFSTGQTLFVLCRTGSSKTSRAVQRGRDYLLRTQLPDGSWLVQSHVKNKAQPFFENGDPHGEHQFISTAATAWATAAMAQLLPVK